MQARATQLDNQLAAKIVKATSGSEILIASQMIGIHPWILSAIVKKIQLFVPRTEHYSTNPFEHPIDKKMTNKRNESCRIANALRSMGHSVDRQSYPFQSSPNPKGIQKYRSGINVFVQSNHDKSVFFTKNGQYKAIITSNNLELQNQNKLEFSVLCDVDRDTFEKNIARNVFVVDKSRQLYEEDDIDIDISGTLWEARWSSGILMGGPGITRGPEKLVDSILETIDTSKSFVHIYTEHITAGFDGYDEVLASLRKAKKRGVEILSHMQSDAVSLGDLAAQRGNQQIVEDWHDFGCQWTVNRNLHAKAVLSDSGGVLMTCNMAKTPLSEFTHELQLKLPNYDYGKQVKFHLAESFTAASLSANTAVELADSTLKITHSPKAASQSGNSTV